MNFKDFYDDYRDAKIKWRYIWGKTEFDLWFHAAFFELSLGEEKTVSTHSSIHQTSESHYILRKQ